jgi:hypothetical protein
MAWYLIKPKDNLTFTLVQKVDVIPLPRFFEILTQYLCIRSDVITEVLTNICNKNTDR